MHNASLGKRLYSWSIQKTREMTDMLLTVFVYAHCNWVASYLEWKHRLMGAHIRLPIPPSCAFAIKVARLNVKHAYWSKRWQRYYDGWNCRYILFQKHKLRNVFQIATTKLVCGIVIFIWTVYVGTGFGWLNLLLGIRLCLRFVILNLPSSSLRLLLEHRY